MTPEAFSEFAWVSSDWRTVDARAYPIRTCPAVSVRRPEAGVVRSRRSRACGAAGPGREGLRQSGTSRNRAVWYCAATLPLPVRHGDPAGAAHEDIGQSLASTRGKSSAHVHIVS